MAAAGVASRRVCEDMIFDGRVEVNGERCEIGAKVDPLGDIITVDGVVVGIDPTRETWLLNKPVGVISSAADTHDREVVTDLIDSTARLFPVGRLDADSEGLLLLTNDGGLAHRLMHPSHGVEKEYLVSVEGAPSRRALRTLREGVELDDGITAPAKVSTPADGMLRIVLHEGRNRQIRRMCDAVGHPVLRLVRMRIGPLVDSTLAPGASRQLSSAEIRSLEEAAVRSTTTER
ncbi:MAG: rRNA pseudouridine synthase [Acidimicrobiales bacterium]|nr:MAG: rRNA pseudouridine synthase [Acidimicrobiales bacterium]